MTTQFAYDTLIVRVGKELDSAYPVEIVARNGLQIFPGGLLRRDAGLLPWVPTDSGETDSRRLTDWFLADAKTASAWAKACVQNPRRRIHLHIDSAAPELHSLPWELLGGIDVSRPNESLSANESTPFSRLLVNEEPPGRAMEDAPIRILAAIANPTDLPRWCLAPIDRVTHLRAVADALAELSPDQYHLTVLEEPVTLDRLEQALSQGHPHILHIVAHGKAFPDQPTRLYLANGDNCVDVDSDEDRFSRMMSRVHKPGLIFLGSCESAKRDTGDAYRGIGPKLVDIGVPAVLAMQDPILDASLQEFTKAFYVELFSYGQVDRAANLARSRLITRGMSGRAVPVLFCRLQDGQLLNESIIQQVRPTLEFEPETVYVPAEQAACVGADQGIRCRPAFRIGSAPVTNRQYAAFTREREHLRHSPSSSQWRGVAPLAGREDLPVMGVSWRDASAYLLWLSNATGRPYRLPSEEEWERAISGGAVNASPILELTSTQAQTAVACEGVMICRQKDRPRTNRDVEDRYRDDVGFRVARDP